MLNSTLMKISYRKIRNGLYLVTWDHFWPRMIGFASNVDGTGWHAIPIDDRTKVDENMLFESMEAVGSALLAGTPKNLGGANDAE